MDFKESVEAVVVFENLETATVSLGIDNNSYMTLSDITYSIFTSLNGVGDYSSAKYVDLELNLDDVVKGTWFDDTSIKDRFQIPDIASIVINNKEIGVPWSEEDEEYNKLQKTTYDEYENTVYIEIGEK